MAVSVGEGGRSPWGGSILIPSVNSLEGAGHRTWRSAPGAVLSGGSILWGGVESGVENINVVVL